MKRSEGYRKFADYHKGEVALLVGSGLGLVNIPGPFLGTYPSFGANRIHVLYKWTGFAPTYYIDLGINHLVIDEQRAPLLPMLEDDQVEAVFANRFTAYRLPFENVYGILGPQYYSKPKGLYFSYEPLDIIGVSVTSMFPMLQVAYYMGFQTALIIGLDHYYDQTSDMKHFYPDKEAPYWDISPGKRVSGEEWYEQAEFAFAMARKAYEMDNRRIVNISEPTRCEVFEKGNWRDWA